MTRASGRVIDERDHQHLRQRDKAGMTGASGRVTDERDHQDPGYQAKAGMKILQIVPDIKDKYRGK